MKKRLAKKIFKKSRAQFIPPFEDKRPACVCSETNYGRKRQFKAICYYWKFIKHKVFYEQTKE